MSRHDRRLSVTPRTPVVLVTGVHDLAMETATLGLQLDAPRGVVVRHRLDVDAQRLTRTVSDVTGVLETHHHDLDHACVSCALREDIIPTIERLAADGRWDTVIAHLPVAAEALQVCRVVETYRDAAPHVRVAAVVAALAGDRVVGDLLGADLLHERALHTSEDDTRGVAETLGAVVEYADVVLTTGRPSPAGLELLRTLARPGVPVVTDPSALEVAPLVAGVHDHQATERWVDVVRRGPLPEADDEHVWTLDLRTDRPFHPGRLLDSIEAVGGGPRRSRGCFWLPSRPGDVCAWDGAGGQLSIGAARPWGLTDHLTRIVVHGLRAGQLSSDPEEVRAAFDACLLSDAEARTSGTFWDVDDDGLEPRLGPVREVA